MPKRITNITVTNDDDDGGCFTNTHQCPPCAYNQVCSASTQKAFNESSPSDWNDIITQDALKPLRFD